MFKADVIIQPSYKWYYNLKYQKHIIYQKDNYIFQKYLKRIVRSTWDDNFFPKTFQIFQIQSLPWTVLFWHPLCCKVYPMWSWWSYCWPSGFSAHLAGVRLAMWPGGAPRACCSTFQQCTRPGNGKKVYIWAKTRKMSWKWNLSENENIIE